MLAIEGLRRRLNQFELDIPQLQVGEGEMFVILGPSGAGKSRLLECLAGFAPHQGRVMAGGLDVTGKPPEQRGVSLLFQEAQLFPHLDVRRNVCFARTPAAPELRQLVESLQLQPLLDLPVSMLSGGQRQLVALARSLVARPRVLLLDEPFSAIDPMQRRDVLRIFREVQSRLALTSLLVTHNFEEALALGHRIGILQAGKLLQAGVPSEVFQHPGSPEVARFLGVENLFQGRIQRLPDEGPEDGELFSALFRGDRVQLRVLATEEGPAHVLIHPYEITLLREEPPPSSALNQLAGRIDRIVPGGALARVWVDAGCTFRVDVTHGSCQRLQLEPGCPVVLSFKASAVKVYGGRE